MYSNTKIQGYMDKSAPIIKSVNGSLIVLCLIIVVVFTIRSRRKFDRIGLKTDIKVIDTQILQNSINDSLDYVTNDGSCNNNCVTSYNLVVKTFSHLITDYKNEDNGVLDYSNWKDSVKSSRLHVENSEDYAFAYEKSAGNSFTNLFHYDTNFQGNTTSNIQTMLQTYCGVDDDMIPLCNIDSLIQRIFSATTIPESGLNWIVIEYPWFNQVTREKIKKRSFVLRLSEDVIVGAGYSVKTTIFEPRESLSFGILGGFGLIAGLLFVLPGPYVDRSIYSMNKLLPEKSYNVVLFQTVVASCLPLIILAFVQGLRCLQIHKNDSTREELKQQDATTRETSVGMALLALSITLMSGLVPEECMNIVFSTVLAFVFSVISVMHLWRMNTNDEMYQSKQVREFCLNMAIMNLLYAFVLIITKYWDKYEAKPLLGKDEPINNITKFSA